MTAAFQSDAFENDAFQTDASTVVSSPVVQTGGGAYKGPRRPRRDFLEERRERQELEKREVAAVLKAISEPVKQEAKRVFRQRLPAFELPDTSHLDIEQFIETQEAISRKNRQLEEEELKELLEIL